MKTSLLRNSLFIYLMATLTAMAPMNLFFFVFLAIFLFNFITAKPKAQSTLAFTDYRFWAVSLWMICWLSLLVAKIFPFSYANHAPEITLHGLFKIWYLLIPCVLFFAYRILSETTSFNLLNLVRPWWIFSLLLLPVALVQFWTGWPQAQPIPTNPGYYHAILFLGHHLSTSSIFIFPAFTALAVAMGIYSRKKGSPTLLSPLLPLIVGLSGLIILFLSYARTAWLSLLIGIFLIAKRYGFNKLKRSQLILGWVTALLVLAIFSQTPLVKERIIRTFGVSERFELWKANFDFFLNRPLTGIGWLKTQEMSEFYFKSIDPENYRSYFWGHAHSNLFEMLGGTGLLGLLAFIGWSWFTLRLSFGLSNRFIRDSSLSRDQGFFYSDLAYGIFVALVLLHFNGLTNVTFWEGKVMHQQMLAVGLLLILELQLPKTKKPQA